MSPKWLAILIGPALLAITCVPSLFSSRRMDAAFFSRLPCSPRTLSCIRRARLCYWSSPSLRQSSELFLKVSALLARLERRPALVD